MGLRASLPNAQEAGFPGIDIFRSVHAATDVLPRELFALVGPY